MDERIKKLRAQAKSLEPVGFIGRNDISENVLAELRRQLKTKKLIKIKVHKSFYEGYDKKDRAQQVADLLNADLVERVGFVIVIAKKGFSGSRERYTRHAS